MTPRLEGTYLYKTGSLADTLSQFYGREYMNFQLMTVTNNRGVA